ncbi:MAG TPA: glycine cleavage system protein GcvH [Candidatus Hydrogenedentes bacterium]|jgi:glycine cleavage system H protein|nr:MAG: Glycine cleavage system H protein [Candidatus Hydrogenedentes bacterium ADurb.Bin170]HNZ48874.1 glycine cleavage system protein GcvH [Candidatus Hydrogenedentota bacterium]HOD96358.1 glycine cleavage system protein GcvH [Candidatus Hydrogenedentota bacterium]HOM48354.1 glycine cleavage system protein GcvH [Candidatus Hydrogenedentota bacterium]HOR51705.1 glycine cleavage system protein GcvH [Candidatus Hydrogenedentota bacterium]
MNPDTLKYTEDHEWIVEQRGLYVVGITEYAVDELGEITFVELPEVGRRLERGEDAAVLESVKAASDVLCPVTGVVAEVNDILEMEPDLINRDTYGKGWILKLKDVNVEEYEELMDSRSYRGYLKTVE